MFSQRRRRLFLDRVQLVLIGRVVAYWFYCLLAALMLASCWTAWTQTPTSSAQLMGAVWRQYGPVLFATVLVLPLVVFDVLRLSNRFVGPIYRLRQALRQAADGQAVRPIQFREKDFWSEVADEFNRAIAMRDADARLARRE